MKWRKKIDKKILKERTGTLCIRTHCTNSSNHIMMHKNDRRPWTHFLLSVSRFEMKIGNYWKPLFLPSCVSNPRLSDQNYLGLSLWYTPARESVSTQILMYKVWSEPTRDSARSWTFQLSAWSHQNLFQSLDDEMRMQFWLWVFQYRSWSSKQNYLLSTSWKRFFWNYFFQF